MGQHVTARLAWHDSGWNGHICNDPAANTYCVGSHSYPGGMISERRDLDQERGCAGQACSSLKSIPPCIYSVNAFGKDALTAFADPPEFFNKGAKRKEWLLPPASVCVWPYEEMYRDEVKSGQGYDAGKRKKLVDKFFSSIEENSSLVFYYSNYSNPFSTDEAPTYVLVGISRVKSVGDDLYYDGCDDRTTSAYGGYVWDRTITSCYPEEGFRLPYHLYKDDSRLESFAVFPDNPLLCKYGSKLMSDDQALGLVEQFHQAVLRLIEMGDTSEDWQVRRKWLEGLISELWQRRGAFPGMAEVCKYLQLPEAIPFLKKAVARGAELAAVEKVWALFDGKSNELDGITLGKGTVDSARRFWKLQDDSDQRLLRDVFARIDINELVIKELINSPNRKHGIRAKRDEILENPYVLCEQYVGEGAEDRLSWGQLDRAMVPSPDLGVPALVGNDSPWRLRALADECLRRVNGHTFLAEDSLVDLVNARMESVPEWKRVRFKARYFEVDALAFEGALTFHEEGDKRYVYLRENYEAERLVERQIRKLMQRPAITLKIPMTEQHWREYLQKEDSAIAKKAKAEYAKAVSSQVATCQKIFTRSLSVLCGAAGTGKTTVLASMVDAIRKVDGIGASIVALAPTGKAADRARAVFEGGLGGGTVETSTIHSFLARRGWLNENLTYARYGGEVEAATQTIIIDECSMMDLHLFATLFRSIDWSTVKRLVLVGDPNQLPPIGVGRVFADIVDYCNESEPDAISELTANLRQLENRIDGRGTGIVELAGLYRRIGLSEEKNEDEEAAAEEMLAKVQASGDVDKDLRVLYWQEPEQLAPLLLDQMTKDMAEDAGVAPDSLSFDKLWRKAFDWKPEYSQILSPYRGELHGIEAINTAVQQHKSAGLINRLGQIDGITLFDKVIQVRNRTSSNPIYGYDRDTKRVVQCDVFNGELGFAGPHGYDLAAWQAPGFRFKRFAVQFARKGEVRVNYGRELGTRSDGKALFDQKVEENLELGYAISVHKAQGSEFSRIYLVVPSTNRQLLSQELLYTALTRGKRHCTLLIQGNVGAMIDMRRRERCWLSRINSSILGWHLAPKELLSEAGWYESGRVHEALTRDMVRSKSEVIIANMLHERGIRFYYERPLYAGDGTMYLPDFTIIWNGEEIYWEHVGMLSNPKYVEHWNAKRAWYEKNFPGQLRVSYERSLGGATGEKLDVSRQADELIAALV